jgi:hypothetical protein
LGYQDLTSVSKLGQENFCLSKNRFSLELFGLLLLSSRCGTFSFLFFLLWAARFLTVEQIFSALSIFTSV